MIDGCPLRKSREVIVAGSLVMSYSYQPSNRRLATEGGSLSTGL